MSRSVRWLLIAFALLIVVIVIVPWLIPVNHFRPTIENKVSAALGRQVTLGNISLSILNGSLSAEHLSIGDDPKFSSSPFLTAKSIKIGVELKPLIFSKALNVTGIAIEAPQVTLLRNDAGQWNYSSLGSPSAAAEPKESPAVPKPSAESSSAGGVSIKQLELKGGQVIIGSASSQKRSTYDHLEVTASDVSMTSKFPITIAVDLPGGSKFTLDGHIGPVDQGDASATPLDAKFKVSSLNLASTGFLDPAAGLGGLLDLEATVNSQGGEVGTKGTAKVSKALLVAGGSPASVPVTVDFNTKYDLRKSAGVLNPSTLKVGNAAAHLNGTYRIVGEGAILDIKVDGQGMPATDLESFLPALGIHLPKGATLEAGTLSANLGLAGPADKLVTSGNVGLYGGKLAGFDLGSKASAVAGLAGIQTGKDLQIEKLTTDLQMAASGLKADHFFADIPSLGTLVGGGTIDSKNNLDFKMAATLTHGLAAAATPVSSVAGKLGRTTGGGSNCKGGTTVPFVIQGTTSEPKFVPDVGGVAAGMLKHELGCAGGVVSGRALAQKPAEALGGVGGLFGRKRK